MKAKYRLCGEKRREKMIEKDTVKLLRECDAGASMGVKSIDDVLDSVKSEGLRAYLVECREKHEKLRVEIDAKLKECGDDGKDPSAVARTMSWIKTNVMLSMHGADSTVADLMTDGCNMGVKSLNRYLNQYEAADERSKDIAKRLIKLEEELAQDIRKYL